MKISRITVIIIIVILAIVIMAFLSIQPNLTPETITEDIATMRKYDLFYVYEVIRYPAYGKVIEPEIVNETLGVGLASSTVSFDFGEVPTNGSYSKRLIILNNTNNNTVMASLQAYGNITPLINFERNNIILKKNETDELGVYFLTKVDDKNMPTGVYIGEIDVVIKRPQYDFLYQFLGW